MRAALDVTVGSATDRQVDVHKLKLDSRRDGIVITGALAAQVGNHGRQLNNYRYEVRRGEVSIDALLKGRPDLQRALSRLAQNPASASANRTFRRCLPRGRPILGAASFERARSLDSARKPVVRVPARVADGGKIVLDKVKGAQIGSWSTQRNNFSYRVEGPGLDLAGVLRNDPTLTRSLAVAIGHPDNEAAQRILVGDLTEAFQGTNPQTREIHHHFRGASKFTVVGESIQIGVGNIRVDKVTLDVGRVVLTGWDHARSLARPAELSPGDSAMPEGNPERIAAARPLGIWPEQRGTRALPPGLISDVSATAAGAALAYWAPGREHLVERLGESLTAALARPDSAAAKEIADLRAHLSAGSSGFQILLPTGYRALGTSQPRYATPGALSTTETRPEFTSLSGRLGRVRLVSTREDPITAERRSAVRGVAVVVCRPVAQLAAEIDTEVLDGEVLLGYARQRLLAELADGTAPSVARAIPAIRMLCGILFFDPAAGIGLWVDVDPIRQVAASSLLVTLDMSAGPPGRFRVYAHDIKVSAQAVSSVTRL